MNKRFYRIISCLVAVFILSTLLVGCQKNEKAQNDAAVGSTQNSSNNLGLPITDKSITLTYWCGLSGLVSYSKQNLGDIELYKELEKRTGVKIKFIHPPATGNAADNFNLMMASGDLPDLIEYNWLNSYPGGPEKAIQDGNIIKLNDLVDKYAVNFKEYLNANEDIDKMVKTDNGSYYVFPYIRGDKWLCTYQGPIVRQDWLDDLKMSVPTTIDEFTAMLRAFKEKKNAETPLTLGAASVLSSTAAFSGAYGIVSGFYLDNGTIKYGPAEPGYKDYLVLLNSWFKERLLDPDFATQDGKTYQAKMTGSKSGATVNAAGGGIGTWTPLLKSADPKGVLAAAPYPTLKKGDKPKIGQYENRYVGASSVAISSQCKEKEIAARWLDYGYSKEGSMLYNFGIENVSYKVDSTGFPKYTEFITNNPDKLPMLNVLNLYMRTYSGPYVQDRREYKQLLTLPEQEAAIDIWSQPENTAWLPPITSSKEESEKMASTFTSIKTYVDEMFLKFVMGQEPLSNFDKYVEQVKKMGLKDVLDIETAAYNRYNKR